MKRSFLFIFLFIVLPLGLRAAIEKDLGQALAYFRVTDASADQAAVIDAIEHRPALVLDLRSLSADDEFADKIHAVLAKTPAAHAVRIVLINSSTAPALVTTLNDDNLNAVITIGPRSAVIKPDVAVTTSDDDDRKAFAALTSGTPLETLIADTRDKRRYDEAKLVHDHANGIIPGDAELPADAEDDSVAEPTSGKKAADAEKKPEPPPPLHDLVLERAVQLHRSLLALKKL